jgi:hypothetical protein
VFEVDIRAIMHALRKSDPRARAAQGVRYRERQMVKLQPPPD